VSDHKDPLERIAKSLEHIEASLRTLAANSEVTRELREDLARLEGRLRRSRRALELSLAAATTTTNPTQRPPR
jgi:hypothetical protein